MGWRGGGVAKYNGVVKVQLRMCWVLLLLCVLLASWVGELVLKMKRVLNVAAASIPPDFMGVSSILTGIWIMGILEDGASL